MITVKGRNIKQIEHMVHHKNLMNILTHGLLSHNKAYEQGLILQDISMPEVQKRRSSKEIKVNNKKIRLGLHDFVSFYFNSRNPMMYKRRNIQQELVILLISSSIIKTKMTDKKFSIFSNGNASNGGTNFYSGETNLQELNLDLIFGSSWNNADEEILKENRRIRCAEVLVYPEVAVSDITEIICENDNTRQIVHSIMADKLVKPNIGHLQVSVNKNYFF